jgi:hypothetical protein
MAKQFGKKAGGLSGSGRASERWIDEELAGCEFQDEWLTKRFEKLYRQLSGGTQSPWPSDTGTSEAAH